MAGKNSAGKLTITLAEQGDDAAIRRLLRESPMRGNIGISLEREPDYFRGTNIAGAQDQTVLVSTENRLICMGKCSFRDSWINGKIQRSGYLGELRLEASAQGRFDILRRGYDFFDKLRGNESATIYYTSIAADNQRARRLLESNRRGLPYYQFLSELVTLLVAVPSHPKRTTLKLEAAEPRHLPALCSLLNEQASYNQLAAHWKEENLLTLANHGLPLGSFQILLEGEKIIAAGAIWDQRAFRQTRIHSYSRSLLAVRPWSNLFSRFRGYPSLPATGSVLKQAFLSPLAFAKGYESLLPDFIRALLPNTRNKDVEFLLLALHATDERLPILRKQFSTRSYLSRLYSVHWPGVIPCAWNAAAGDFLPDLGLL